jgi:peptidyl-Lys metalloendopeptidase
MSLEGLSVSIEFDRRQYKATDRQNLRFALNNDSNKEMTVLKWNTPFDGFNSDMFKVSRNRTRSLYLGRVVKRGAPKPEDYITIKPKGSLSIEFDISEAYDIYKEGGYSVEYKSALLDAGLETPEVLARNIAAMQEFGPKRVQSNVASFDLTESREPRLLKGVALDVVPRMRAAAIEKGMTSFNNCTANQQKELSNALNEATRIALEAKKYLSSITENNRSTSVRYKTWFGRYSKQRYNKVTNNFDKIWDAFQNKGVTFNCDCSENYFAYVYPTKPYEIFLCKLFWAAPLTGTDSRAGTIVHETSHFNVVAGTDDHVYGQSGCKKLALSKPAEAIDNADSHEYFAENTPPLK